MKKILLIISGLVVTFVVLFFGSHNLRPNNEPFVTNSPSVGNDQVFGATSVLNLRQGGTGLKTYTAGDMVWASTSAQLFEITNIGTVGQCWKVSTTSPAVLGWGSCASAGTAGALRFKEFVGGGNIYSNKATSLSFDAGGFSLSTAASNTNETLVRIDYSNGPASRAATNTWTALNTFNKAGLALQVTGNASVSANFEVGGTASVGGTFFGNGTGSNSFAGSLNVTRSITSNQNITALNFNTGGLYNGAGTGSNSFAGSLNLTKSLTSNQNITGLNFNTSGLYNGAGTGSNSFAGSLNVTKSITSNQSITGLNFNTSGLYNGAGTGSNSFAGSLNLTKSLTVSQSITGSLAIIGTTLRALTNLFFPTYTGTSLAGTGNSSIHTGSSSLDFNDSSVTKVLDGRACFTFIVDSPTASNPGFVGPKMFDNPFTIINVRLVASGSNAAGWNLKYGNANSYTTSVFTANKSASTSSSPIYTSAGNGAFTNSTIADGQGLEAVITSRSAILQSFSINVCGRYNH